MQRIQGEFLWNVCATIHPGSSRIRLYRFLFSGWTKWWTISAGKSGKMLMSKPIFDAWDIDF
jgi:hypothetical protein